jgi:hypothetical protein
VPVNGQRPVLSGGAATLQIQVSDIVLDGLELTGGTVCLRAQADALTFENGVIHGCNTAVLADGGSLTLDHAEVFANGTGPASSQLNIATDESNYPGAVFRMQFSYVHDAANSRDVLSRAERNELYYNWVEGNTNELMLVGADAVEFPPPLAREDSDIVGNVLVHTASTDTAIFGGDSIGASSGRYRFVSNTVLTTTPSPGIIALRDNVESLEADDNAFVATAGTEKIVFSDDAVWVAGVQISGSNNWVSSTATNIPTTWVGTLSGTSPGFANLATFALTPAAGSPLIDAGTATPHGPAGHELPNGLFPPIFQPPQRRLDGSGVRVLRPIRAPIDVGAFEGPAGSSVPADGSPVPLMLVLLALGISTMRRAAAAS